MSEVPSSAGRPTSDGIQFRHVAAPIPSHGVFQERPCPNHPGKWLVMVCTTCRDAFVCLTCINTSHTSHMFVEIEEYLDLKRHLFSRLKQVADTKLTTLKQRLEKARDTKKESKQNMTELGDYIKSRADEMKKQIDQICEDYTKQCRNIGQKNDDLLGHVEDRMQRHFDDLSEAADKCKEVLDQEKYQNLLHTEKNLKQQNSRPYDLFPNLQSMGIIMSDKMTRMMTQFGYMDTPIWKPDQEGPGKDEWGSDATNDAEPYKVKLLGSFQMESQKQVLSVCPIDNTSAWLICTGSSEATLTTNKGNITVHMRVKPGVKLNDIVCSADRSNVFCCAQSSVRSILPDGKYKVLFRTEDYASSLCEAKDGGIIVCHDDKGKMIHYNGHGDVIKVITEDLDGWKLFSWPRRVRVNRKNGDMAVIEETTPRHVAVMDSKMDELCRFQGIPNSGKSEKLQEEQNFLPRDICFDRNNDIIIADYGHGSVIVIDRDGRLVRTVWRDEMPPTCVGLQPNGDLWVGFLDGQVKVLRYIEH
ncbi:uncharacterized protein LOC110452892 [Mizuhopecten yessoensis]|uniref:B box-type domain-containing protein n=1 Tax=Mizuhopecten yessoensis TaxID=6573 RepID=A0A210QIR6_MIZYE|nr:uncharacterized protein LOC110452892 [Mizuhopecten yessoensis]OWF48589.1 hypothetical protein KP79_PYT04512 [Mizuhopecten yessoensis]